MPIFDVKCDQCGKAEERFLWRAEVLPQCCGQPMKRMWTLSNVIEKWAPPLWVHRIDEIHKAQEQRGERLRVVHPKEVGAT